MELQRLLLVYGSLKEGFRNHRVLRDDAKKVGEFVIEGWDMVSLGGFPAIDKGEGSIYVEAYTVEQESWEAVEYLEGYPSFYDRAEVETPMGLGSVYFIDGIVDKGYPPVEDGNWQEGVNYANIKTA